MKQKVFLLLYALLLFSFNVVSQNISVKSFKVLPNDQTARVTDPVTDQNGEKCALLKVVTDQQGFVWESGILGIIKKVRKTGEYWIYVPRGSKKITIKHDQLGVLRDYVYPEPLKTATVYEMKLTTAKVKTVVEEPDISSAYLVIKSSPEGADVFIDDKFRGKTPFNGRFKSGDHTYRLTKSKYHPTAGKIEIMADEGRKELNLNLKPNYGGLYLTSEPESGMEIFLDGESTGKKTPTSLNKIQSGEYTISLKNNWYQPISRKVTIQDEKTKEVNLQMTPVYGNVYIKTNPPSDIYINGNKVGNGNYKGRVIEGIHTFEAKKDKYTADKTEKEIISSKNVNINLNPQPKYGKLDISSDPIDAKITLNGKDYGQTPTVVSDLLVGTYDLELIKVGYSPIKKTFQINENQTTELQEKLASSKKVTISSDPSNANFYINNEFKGRTPVSLNLSYSQHDIRLEKKQYESLNKDLKVVDDKDEYIFAMKPLYQNVRINSDPTFAKIYVNGKLIGKTPENVDLPIGNNVRLRLEKEKYLRKTKKIKVNEELDQIEFELRISPEHYTTKVEGMFFSSLWPGWGSAITNNNYFWGTGGQVLFMGLTNVIGYVMLIDHLSGGVSDFQNFALAHGIAMLADWIVILSSSNYSKRKAKRKAISFNETFNIHPGFNLQPNPITMNNDLMFSMTFTF